MKRFLATTICTLPLVMSGSIFAQGTKGPSGSGAENASKQSRNADSGHRDNAHSADTREKQTSTPAADPATAGSPDSMTSVPPANPPTASTTKPDAGNNRASSGDSATTAPKRPDHDKVK